MRSRLFSRLARFAFGAALLGAFSLQLAATAVGPVPGARPQRRGFNLNAEVFTIFVVNRIACGIDNLGQVCVDPGNSPLGGGGFWPKGTPDQYIFNSGIQVAGIVDPASGFAWSGDTSGAYFMDARGDQGEGEGITPVYNSLDPQDAAAWPSGGIVRDTSLYDPVLIGRQNLSQQDLWVRTWDGNPAYTGSARTHPLGILVEERGLAWNFPSGNEDILYFIFTLYNVTASDPAVYSGLDPAIQGDIAAIGQQFHDAQKATLGVDVPAGGYAINNAYAAFFMDADVADAFHNFSTAILPFQLALAYQFDFQYPAGNWKYPADIFGPPFAPAPGFIGVKYLKSPVDPVTGNEVGLTMFSNTLNSSTGFPDPVGVKQLWRYLSGNVNPSAGDNPCTVTNPQARRLCFLAQNDADTRFYQSSGPFTLNPGEAFNVVVAYVQAAPVASAIAPFIGTSSGMKPGIPGSGVRILAGVDSVRDIERAAGWISYSDDNGNGDIEQTEVKTVPRSLLDKSLVAQAVFDNKFLLPFAPEPPTFYLVPGNNQVTVVWEPSPTETVGDPFYAVASDVTSPLYDPDFRQFDVEGYRIYRGRTAGQLEMIAQFDYANTTFGDANAQLDYGNCAPELGITADCPVTFGTDTNYVDISGDLVQVAPGNRVLLADSTTVIVLSADTAVSGGGSNYPAPTNTGVPFAFVDKGVLNSFTYFYAVTAFDVNSIKSGPTSLESARVTQTVQPRAGASNLQSAVASIALQGRGEDLDPSADFTIDPTTGEFTGPPPPTDLFNGTLQLFASTALQAGDVFVRIDSINPEYYHNGTYYLTLSVNGTETHSTLGPNLPLGIEQYSPGVGNFDPIPVSIPADPDLATSIGQEGLPFAGQAIINLDVREVTFTSRDIDWQTQVEGSFFNNTAEGLNDIGGSRWFSGDNESTPDPTLGTGHGALDGVNTIYSPTPYVDGDALFRRNLQTTFAVVRAADTKVYWSASGTVDSVVDVTHNMPVPVLTGPNIGVGYGFRTDISGNDVDYTAAPGADGVVSLYDFGHGPCFPGRASWTSPGCETRPLAANPTLSQVDIDGDGAADGMGFAMYLNGEFYIFQTDALPASTVWTLRSYTGKVDRKADGTYTFTPHPRNPAVPGLEVRVTVTSPASPAPLTAADLDGVHTVPDPYYVTNPLEITANRKVLTFVGLPPQAIIRIYTVSGVLVNVLEHNDVGFGGQETWNLRNRNNQFVASGVYFFHVETPNGLEKVGRFTVVNFAQ